jgi:hypothetical protein
MDSTQAKNAVEMIKGTEAAQFSVQLMQIIFFW